ncbi:regulatory helix-turn-helix protein, lysR family [Brevundimonas sp. 374]|nr:regulatory helix-turn-helix protein, lysR family [Brevundimonas sp. 374]
MGGSTDKSQFGSLRVAWLEAFVLSVQYGKQTAAASEMGVTQGTISKHIENLELWYGGGQHRVLLLPNMWPPTLTDDGKAFFPVAERAVAGLSELKASRPSLDAPRSPQPELELDDLVNNNGLE